VDQYRLACLHLRSILYAATATTGTDAASTMLNDVSFAATICADATAYSAYPPQNCLFVTLKTSSPG
jgi:hypothetical protein